MCNHRGEPVCAQTCDYGSVSNPIKNTLTAGSHYKEYSTLWFKTHYYSNVNVKKVTLSIGDQCVELKQTRGSAQNAVFGTSELSDINECTPYFFESMDVNGGLSTCAIVLVAPDGTEYEVEGHCPGRIAEAPSGAGGFGYDPLFVPDGFNRSFAELSANEKNAISHRGRALAAARAIMG